jgi:hypothetical protein
MNDERRTQLSTDMLACRYAVKKLLGRIFDLELDTETSSEEKLSEMKKIKDEMMKVSAEIDKIKKEIKLLGNYNVN